MHISARRHLPVAPDDAFAFLSRPHNHRRLVTTRIALHELELTSDGRLRGARMALLGPLWLRRPARTRVVSASRPAHLAGTARVGSGTEVEVRWDLEPAAAGTTLVSLSATAARLAASDRLLLALGGRAWVRRLFGDTLEQLAEEVCKEPGRICAEGRREEQAWRLPTLIGANPRWR